MGRRKKSISHGHGAVKPHRHGPAGISNSKHPRSLISGNATTALLSGAAIVGLVALGNHGKEFDVRQPSYDTLEDCVKEWHTEEYCRATAGPGPSGQGGSGYGGGGYGVHYSGPRYYWDSERGAPVIVENGVERVATGTSIGERGSSFGRTSVVGSFARGGFGGIGRGFSGGRGG